jgi:glycosyltransferase involved in cell wall biosynthesis
LGKDRIKKVLLIDNSVEITGAYRSINTFIEKLNGRIDFYAAVPNGCWTQSSEIPPEKIFIFKFLELTKSLKAVFYLPMLVWNILKISLLVRKHSIDIVHVNDLYNMVGVGLKMLHPNIKLIYHVRLRKTSYARSLFHLWIGIIRVFADSVICVSKTVAVDLGFDGKFVKTIYDSVPERVCYVPPPNNAYLKFLYVGNFIPGKGQDYAIEAFISANKVASDIRLEFIGGTGNRKTNETYVAGLKRRIATANLEKYVRFLPAHDKVYEQIAACDVTLNFSESESFSMVCLEALAVGRPVIATRSGGPEEIIIDNINGILVGNKQVSDMAEAMIKMILNRKLILKLSENSRMDVDGKFSLEKLSKNLYHTYIS